MRLLRQSTMTETCDFRAIRYISKEAGAPFAVLVNAGGYMAAWRVHNRIAETSNHIAPAAISRLSRSIPLQVSIYREYRREDGHRPSLAATACFKRSRWILPFALRGMLGSVNTQKLRYR
jgi:hypothetical protein